MVPKGQELNYVQKQYEMTNSFYNKGRIILFQELLGGMWSKLKGDPLNTKES